MDSDDIIQELLSEDPGTTAGGQFQQHGHTGSVMMSPMFSALQESDGLIMGRCNGSGYDRFADQRRKRSQWAGVMHSQIALESAGTVDDLNGLNTWDFAVMRSEFGDLQSIDSAELIDLYCRQHGDSGGSDCQQLIDLTDDDSLLELRSRSDSGYSTGSCQQLQQQLEAAQQTTAAAAAASFWCQSPTCISCASSSDGADSPSSSLLASPVPLQTQQQPPLQHQLGSSLAGLMEKKKFSQCIAPSAGGAVKKAKKQRTKVSKARQLQLWQFLYQQLDIGSSGSCSDSDALASVAVGPPNLHWLSRQDGVFRIANPNGLAEAWGRHRRRDNMTYEKMSRTLRYYYDRRLITKVTGKQHTYKFHYDQFPEQE